MYLKKSTQKHITVLNVQILNVQIEFITLFLGAAIGSEKAKKGKARLTNPFL